MFTRRCSRQIRKWRSEFASGFKIFLTLLLLSSFFTTGVFGQVGTVPVSPPTGGLQIDGSLKRLTVHGDWFAGDAPFNAPSSSYLFNPNGTSPYPALLNNTLFWKIDAYTINGTTTGGTGIEDRFTNGSHLNNDPNTWGWDTHAPQSKDDINNAFFFIVLDTINHPETPTAPGHHFWALMAGDREATNGTSFLDFEFLQHNITKVADGTFTADGPDGGRTVNDLDVTLSFTGGGGIFTPAVFQWNPVGDGTFIYSSIPTPAGTTFIQSNKTQPTPFPGLSGAFGLDHYTDSLQFVEAAIDITALLGSGISTPCRGLPFTTIFIKTKSSAAPTAELKDLIAPFALNVCTDNVPPTITTTGTPANGVLGCNPTTAAIDAALGTATATDACSTPTVTHTDGAVSSSGCSRSETRTWTATDACGNTATASRTATWTQDVTAPTITTTGTPANGVLGCNPTTAAIDAALGTATATDACGTPTVTHTDGAVSSNGCLRSETRTWTATDACGNTATASRTATWTSDVTPPTITATGNSLTLGCNPSTATIDGALGSATATDACGTPTVSHSDGGISSDGCSRSQTRTFTATDACGNTATASRTATWTFDITPPTLTATGTPANGVLGCNPTTAQIDGALGTASATDACGTPTVTHTDGSVQSSGCSRSQTRSWTATDGCGNTATTSRTATWTEDVTAPTITATGGSLTLGCNPSTATIDGALGTASATDACGTPTVTHTDGTVQSSGCSRSQTRSWTATDGCGNTSTAARTATWTFDITPPTLTATGTGLTLCNPSTDQIEAALGTATATDACGTPTVTHSDGAITGDCAKSQTRTFTATDACGNTATTSRTAVWSSDNTPPTITATGTPANGVLGCNPTTAAIDAALGTASATDACGTPTVTHSDGGIQSDGCSRSQTRTFTATDGCGNTATTSRTATWTFDITAPTLTTTGNALALGCNPSTAAIDGALGTASATDACGTPTVTHTDGSISSDGCSRSETRTWTATDACGNTATASRTATWTFDITPPTLTATGGALTLGCNPDAGTINGALGTASATDACGTPTVTHTDGNVSSDGCSRSQTRTWTATDGCGNTATTSRTATWTSDVTPPTLTATGGALTLGCNPSTATINGALGTATATDACGTPTITATDGAVQSNGCGRSQTRTWTATDGCGNTATTSRTATWTFDITPPTITATGTPADGHLGCNPSTAAIEAALGTASATDACGTPTVTHTDGAVQSNGCGRSETRTWTATDACGNTATISRTATWTFDITPPTITTTGTPANGVIEGCNPSTATISAALGTATATDACGTPTITASDGAVVTSGCNFSQTRTWTATDACGNTSTASRTATWQCCPSVLCTYTQGYYGNAGGLSCSGVPDPAPNTFTTTELIEHDIQAVGSGIPKTITIGCAGHSVTIIAGQASCVIDVLPGGGASGPLPPGDNNICSLPASLLKNGRINNALLAQTIALTLNTGINYPTLSNFALQANKWLVTADVVECGSNTIKACQFSCTPVLDPITGLPVSFTWAVTFTPYHVSSCRISQALFDALGTKDVKGLLVLANSALCGTALPAGVSYTDITDAEDCINNAFDECKSFVTWASGATAPTAASFCSLPSSSTPCPTVTAARPISESFASTDYLKVTAYPNPFKATVKFTIVSTVSGQAQLEVYNTLGQRVSLAYSGYLQANRGQVVEYKAPRLGSNLIYILRVGSKQVTGKLLRIE
jgi:hypothetical protein